MLTEKQEIGLLYLPNRLVLFCKVFYEKWSVYDMDGNKRSDVRAGIRVRVVKKEHQRTGELTEGVVKDILTNSPNHPHGIKVRLEDGTVGRIKDIL